MTDTTEAKIKSGGGVVTEFYYPQEIPTGYYLTRLAEDMTAYSTNGLCGQPNYSARGIRVPKHETRNGVEIFRAGDTNLSPRHHSH